jgi:hypothetical protein
VHAFSRLAAVLLEGGVPIGVQGTMSAYRCDWIAGQTRDPDASPERARGARVAEGMTPGNVVELYRLPVAV